MKISLMQIFWILVVAGLFTLMPFKSEEACYLGYHSVCPFAPASTLIIAFFALVVIMKHRKNLNENTQTEKE